MDSNHHRPIKSRELSPLSYGVVGFIGIAPMTIRVSGGRSAAELKAIIFTLLHFTTLNLTTLNATGVPSQGVEP